MKERARMRIHVRKEGEGGKEHYVIIVFREERAEVIAGTIDFEYRRATIEYQKEIPHLEEALTLGPSEELKKILGNCKKGIPYTLTIVMHPGMGITKYETMRSMRVHPERMVGEKELQGIVEYVIDHSFTESAEDTLHHLGRARLETFLADMRVLSVRVDDHWLYEKLGHTGKELSIYMTRTFVVRSLYHRIIEAVPPWVNRVVWREGGAMTAHVLTRYKQGIECGLYAKVMETRTNIYAIQNSMIGLFDYFPWGKRNCYEAMGSWLAVGAESTEDLTRRCAEGDCSRTFQKKCAAILDEELALCLKGVESARWRMGRRGKKLITYLDCMPYVMDAHVPKTVTSLGVERLMEMYGLTLYNKKDARIIKDTAVVAALLERLLSPRLPVMENVVKNKMTQLGKHR